MTHETKKTKIKTENRSRTIIITLAVSLIVILLILLTSEFWITNTETYRKVQSILCILALTRSC